MSEQHTPGPWKVSAIHRDTTVVMADRLIVCEVGRNAGIWPEIKADALLIAAAPDLLAALSNLVAASQAARRAEDANLALGDDATVEEVEAILDAMEDAQATLIIRENEALAALRRARGE